MKFIFLPLLEYGKDIEICIGVLPFPNNTIDGSVTVQMTQSNEEQKFCGKDSLSKTKSTLCMLCEERSGKKMSQGMFLVTVFIHLTKVLHQFSLKTMWYGTKKCKTEI